MDLSPHWRVFQVGQTGVGIIMSRAINKILIVVGIIALWESKEHIVPAINTVINTVTKEVSL